ncbi:mitochondrial import inner membrane translocase subunit [Raphidocelis subcapitata]|uniref:Mitochondrial import inner membrane translocase subunit n=1 Tax=Raphidocelis subcapitata TaxID=307507 RepID=A0A2V0NY38_9CHLO|nr:mitochondrial import inner membrane translocase subunit [Raphidocelis subcapitata]|eukprot:GBF90490.1 mitochondrial import inner membrane translocase subunit [Raphidocelis subcapitata]
MAFGSSGASTSGGFSTGAHEEHRVMEEVQTTLRMQYVQEFYQTVRDKCFKVCVTSPGGSLSGGEQKCLSRCMDRYQEATQVVTKAVVGMQGLE